MTPAPRMIRVSPETLTITPPEPASPTLSGADSECSDDGSNSPCSFNGEECPDLCGGPKNSCRSWTPPASPFYYANEGGIFLLDDRQNFEQRQKIEVEHTLHDLDERLQRLRETMSPPRFLNRRPAYEISAPSSPSGIYDRLSRTSSPSSTPSESYPYDCEINLRRCKFSHTRSTSPDFFDHTTNSQEKDETGVPDLGQLIHTSLQHVQSTNSPPRYLANVTETQAQPSPREPIAILNSHEKLRDEASLMRHASPQLHFGNTAYPTPLPSSPESKPSRKRGRDEGSSQDGSGLKRRRGEDDEWISPHCRLRVD
ncbi:hypothetical protein IMSHALPRED_002664 [Imshaugia aleurites]|uniref:Uncharacterized protein n=1 Tax=Imshaugia aleurites TaxID=172621 RepID=A0A8H3IHA1_9LECA|nr:hypothetical protein IMSHALPRED_002664 [Imshaugia aleurites]